MELSESARIAGQQIRANRTRSFLTGLGVIIGIIAVTLMGIAIKGIDTGFDQSMNMLGEDVLYVEQYPWDCDPRLLDLQESAGHQTFHGR